jgi:predicted MPP superfamily phosphohydrolase
MRGSRLAGGLAVLGAGALAYSTGYEVRAFRLRRHEVACLPAGSAPVKVLHLSDIHLTPSQGKKQAWLRELAALNPDLIVNTGDNLSHHDSPPYVLAALGDLLDLPGVFVFGSNDYWGPVVKNPLRYLLPNGGGRRIRGPRLPWHELQVGFTRHGWLDLTNSSCSLTIGSTGLTFTGVDDPHLGYDRLDQVAGPADASADLRVGVTHAPYLRVLDAFTRDGYDVIFAGHTHGGQLRVPGYGALVTNCDLDTRRSRGLHTYTAAGRTSHLHVSAGLGTSPYAPVRFACFPEATLLTLTARPVDDGEEAASLASALR